MINKILKYPPIKYNIKNNFPKTILRHSKVNTIGKNNPIDFFIMCSMGKKGSNNLAYMTCEPSFYTKNGKQIKSLRIENIVSKPINKGMGTRMLNFAKRFSRENNCNGNFHLFADTCYMPEQAPHLFYRKYGMYSGDKEIDHHMDEFIRMKKFATEEDFEPMIMYFTS